MSRSQSYVTSTPTAEWESAFQLAAETMERVSRQQFEVVAVEIDGQQVWTKTQPAPANTASQPGLPSAGLSQRFDRIETALAELVRQRTVKDWYSTEEAGQILGKSEYTVREWCRNGRINAEKKGSGPERPGLGYLPRRTAASSGMASCPRKAATSWSQGISCRAV